MKSRREKPPEERAAVIDVSKGADLGMIEAPLIDWLAAFGNITLALKHPGNRGSSRVLAFDMLDRIGAVLVAGGLLARDQLDFMLQRDGLFDEMRALGLGAGREKKVTRLQ